MDRANGRKHGLDGRMRVLALLGALLVATGLHAAPVGITANPARTPLGSDNVPCFAQNTNYPGYPCPVSSIQNFITNSVKYYGAKCDGATNDTTAILAATLDSYIPPGNCATTLTNNTFVPGLFVGRGQIKAADGSLTAPIWESLTQAPSSLGNWNSILTAFQGDLSHVPFAIGHVIQGAATLGQPASGYMYTDEASAIVIYSLNASGFNHDTTGNGGRTANTPIRVHLFNEGQGDHVAFNTTAFVTGSRAGATSFLANPAVSAVNGDFTAGNAGVYLNPLEFVLHDGGFDVAGLGPVINLDRNNATGALGAWWGGLRIQSIGSAEIDDVISGSGKMAVFLDATPMTLDGTTKALFATPQNGRWYTNASTGTYHQSGLGTNWIEDNSSISAFNFVYGNSSILQVGATGVFAEGKLYPGAPGQVVQNGGGILASTGNPSNTQGSNGDFYLRTDCTHGTNNCTWHKEGGTWFALN